MPSALPAASSLLSMAAASGGIGVGHVLPDDPAHGPPRGINTSAACDDAEGEFLRADAAPGRSTTAMKSNVCHATLHDLPPEWD
jgi:hypothetical protein